MVLAPHGMSDLIRNFASAHSGLWCRARRVVRVLTWVTAAGILTSLGGLQSQEAATPAKSQPRPQVAASVPAEPTGKEAPKANSAGKQTAEGVIPDRRKQMTDESAQLLSLAIALKAEVDKTSKDTLSLTVIRKAGELERLAHSMKETLRQSTGPS